ncbi:response regulator [Almyronema epifaneia]|uniref:Response regulator n=1 Tax=Almyronema epifaneia S1 TaxID=2991925 RepID=A0ABW6IE91_9CYAN
MRVLLIEDDEILSEVLLQTLSEHRYAVDHADDGPFGLEYALGGTYDLILLDVGLPRLDGISVCQALRNEGYTTPILLMTAQEETEERIRGLDAGADDYLIKPFDLGELQARVRALLRRGSVTPSTILEIDDLRLDPICCQVTYQQTPLKLTPKEYSLLELFMRNPQRVFSRGQIVEHLWTFDDPPLEDSVKAHVKGLRRKLKQAGAADWIENVYGLGYKLTPQTAIASTRQNSAPARPTEPPLTGQTDFNQAMAALWQQYAGLMQTRMAAIAAAASALEQNQLTDDLKTAASTAAHKLAGVLGMFDRADGTQLARALEHQFAALAQPDPAEVLPRVQQLEALLKLNQSATAATAQPEPSLWLISNNNQLLEPLQSLSQTADLLWQQITTTEAARQLLRSRSPELVVLDVENSQQLQADLPLLADLAARSPAVPTLVLAQAAALGDRIQIATVGSQGLLSKPVTASQIWELASQSLRQSRSQTATVLAVDDDPILLASLRPMLEPWGLRVVTLSEPTRFWQVLKETQPDLVVLDVEMPGFSGIELCRAVRIDPHWQDLPIVFLTAHQESETVQQVFAAGADDYVTKPILGPELLTRLTNRLERNRLLQTLASQDAKTGLANQPHSQQQLEQLIQQAGDRPLAFALFKLTQLPNINLQHGHPYGNQVLRRWGELFRAYLPSHAVLGYWENGEFVVGLANATADQAPLAPLLAALRKQVLSTPTGTRFQVSYQWSVVDTQTQTAAVPNLYQAAIETLSAFAGAEKFLPKS